MIRLYVTVCYLAAEKSLILIATAVCVSVRLLTISLMKNVEMIRTKKGDPKMEDFVFYLSFSFNKLPFTVFETIFILDFLID